MENLEQNGEVLESVLYRIKWRNLRLRPLEPLIY